MVEISLVIADDQILFVDILKNIIDARTEDFKIFGTAYNGKEAIEVILDKKPDIALVDIRMPGIDGINVTKRVLEELPLLKVVILTTFPDDDYVEKALEYGAVGYLLKNMPVDDLISSLRSIYGGSFVISQKIAKIAFRKSLSMKRGEQKSDHLTEKQRETAKLLSRREREVYELMVKGYSNLEIADMLYISIQTVKNHISSIYGKIGIHNRSGL